ncbi:hypothetical protein [Halomonas koreensis]|uniref:Uncharacterized protein n=1 Tax=Halomonas koreensis TaxID=245385 RepID=A0ABU1FZM9_9GAMM|nr:hypothetical protein [Halomonas koreensis]MDR5866140.1 hypothetical protein [Halomonas koreensis]
MSQTRAYAAFAADRPLIPYPFERMDRGDVRYRFVIDMASLKA